MKRNCWMILLLAVQTAGFTALCSFPAAGQGFAHEFGGPGSQVGRGVARAENGEIVVLAEENWDPATIGFGIRWYRLDAGGNEISTNLLPGFSVVGPRKLLPLGDDRFWVGGYSLGFTFSGEKPFLAEFDANGALQWQTYYDLFPASSSSGIVEDIDQLPTGDFLLTAMVVITGWPSTWTQTLLRVDRDGNLLWHRTDSLLGDYFPVASAVFEDGSFVTASTVRSSIGAHWESWLTKSRADGTIEWERPVHLQNGVLGIADLEIGSEGEILAVGYRADSILPLRAVFVVLDRNGNPLQETEVLPDRWNASRLHDLRILPDGSVIACGSAFNPSPPATTSQKALLAGLNQSGDLLWVNLVDNPSNHESDFRATYPISEGRILAVGLCNAASAAGNSSEVFLAETSCRGEIALSSDPGGSIKVWPVPSSGELFIRPSGEGECFTAPGAMALEVYDLRGRLIAVPYEVFYAQVHADLALLARGIYLVRLREGDKVLYSGRVERL